ncbi:unnamed protein product [Lupinus luteus]|uniref:BOI-related E3 ubiquitin-protein ligase 3 n=1 Tax=Lupinus luteus TaxID=3873 RepID=A0AAV1WLH8_LUPLU
MEVEAHHFNLFSPQLISSNREMMNPVDNINLYNTHQMGYNSLLPLSGTTTADNIFRPPCHTFIAADSFPQKTAMNSGSNLTYNVPLSRKRSRENPNTTTQPYNMSNCGSFSFLGEHLSLHLHQQQFDISNIISEQVSLINGYHKWFCCLVFTKMIVFSSKYMHSDISLVIIFYDQIERLRMEVVEKRKRQTRKIIETIEVSVMKRLKAKENEIEKIGKLNHGLEEKIKSLCIDNKIWRELAQSNEATANALRNVLDQVLIHRDGGATINPAGAAVPALMADASSCCGSTDDVKNKEGVWRRIIGYAGVKDKEGGDNK